MCCAYSLQTGGWGCSPLPDPRAASVRHPPNPVAVNRNSTTHFNGTWCGPARLTALKVTPTCTQWPLQKIWENWESCEVEKQPNPFNSFPE